jgi:2-keto-4-pentenoate hydratase/2-oxohepta-3-ene-1,7-dioic acid hydratase in catechol pathway
VRLGTARSGDREVVVAEHGALLHEVAADGRTLAQLIAAGLSPGEIADRAAPEPLADARLLAPLRPGKIVAIGLNYRDHIRETGMDQPAAPMVFAKFPSSVIGPDEAVVIDAAVTQRVDWEVELAVVVGRELRNVSESDALDGVFGYTVANDVSARDLQLSDGQWTRGKSLDTFCPLGPLVVAAAEIDDPQALRLQTRVNGELVQDASTAEMLFGVRELLAFCSRAFTLEPGDVLLTGTPWGCGEWTTPPRHLHPGDRLETWVEGVGTLANPVVAAEPAVHELLLAVEEA